MSQSSDLKDAINTKTLNLVLLTIATVGIYLYMWLYRNSPKIEKITGKSLPGDVFLIVMVACSGFGGVLSDIGAEAGSDGMVISGALAVIVSAVLLCVWGYKVRGVLQDYAASQFKVDFRLNALNAMILNVFYINYCINELPELVQRQKMIAGASESNN